MLNRIVEVFGKRRPPVNLLMWGIDLAHRRNMNDRSQLHYCKSGSVTFLQLIKRTKHFAVMFLLAFTISYQLAPITVANAAKIENRVAVFSGIDKITGRIITFDVYIDETVQFGALQVTPRVCYSRDDTEQPKTTAFLEVDEITLNRKIRRIFTGWMFADSPGLNAVENPVYDVWLKNCKMDSEVPAPQG